MSFTDQLLLLALVNFVICSAIGYASVCRLNAMRGRDTRLLFRVVYTLLVGAATSHGWSPLLWAEFPGVADVMFNAVVLLLVCSGMHRWRDGPPDYARSTHRAKERTP